VIEALLEEKVVVADDEDDAKKNEYIALFLLVEVFQEERGQQPP